MLGKVQVGWTLISVDGQDVSRMDSFGSAVIGRAYTTRTPTIEVQDGRGAARGQPAAPSMARS